MSHPRRWVSGVLLVLAAATLAGLALLWPAHRHVRLGAQFRGPGGVVRTVPAFITSVRSGYCGIDSSGDATLNPPPGQGYACQLVEATLHGGPRSGTSTQLQLVPGVGTPPVAAGERIRVIPQASAVWELKLARPTASRREVYRSAMRVGRDHVASASYTLVLAYVGAALPTLLVFGLSGQDVFDVVTSDTVAVELVASLVGVLGLVLVVPITTAVSAVVVAGLPPAAVTLGSHPPHLH